jgi:DNA-binding IclR family transcriptional regulator
MTSQTETKRLLVAHYIIEVLAADGEITTREVADSHLPVGEETARETLKFFETIGYAERASDHSNTWYGTKEFAGIGARLMKSCDGVEDVPTPPWEQ